MFLGDGHRVPDGEAITLEPSDPRLTGFLRNYAQAEAGCYIRAVTSRVEPDQKVQLSEVALNRLRALGYLETDDNEADR